MSIVPLKKVTFVGMTGDKEKVLRSLQNLGCLEIIPLHDQGDHENLKPSTRAKDALRFLLDCPQKRRQIKDPSRFSAEKAKEVEGRAVDLQKKLFDLNEERDFLYKRGAALNAWGEFKLPSLDEMDGIRLWFYVVPHKDMPSVMNRPSTCWQLIRRDQRFCYIVIISKEEPTDMPVEREHLGNKNRQDIEQHIEEIEFEIEDLQAERVYLTRWIYLFSRSLDLLEDGAARAHVAGQTLDQEPVFALQAWAPTQSVQELQDYCSKENIVFESTAPEPGDNPPTLMHNPEKFAAGEGLVTFYMTPGYQAWDPSITVFCSFAIFFSMILSDAGYAVVMLLGLLFFWKKMESSKNVRRWRSLLAMLVTASIAYGIMVGSYFGLSPRAGTLLSRLNILDLQDSNKMMMISVIIGVIHVCLGAVMDAIRHGRSSKALPSYGWVLLIGGGFVLSIGATGSIEELKILGGSLLVVGAILIVLFSGLGQKPLNRIGTGLLALAGITGAFGDILSYLRLFALGVASASLAVAFNDMSAQIHQSMPGVGLFFAILVLILGHSLNLLLGISSGVIHGMRLNVIEFFNWALKEEGKIFQPFHRKERF